MTLNQTASGQPPVVPPPSAFQRLRTWLAKTSADPMVRRGIIVVLLLIVPLVLYSISVTLANAPSRTDRLGLAGISLGIGATLLWIFTLWFRGDLVAKFVEDQNAARAAAGQPKLTDNDPLVITIGNSKLLDRVDTASYRAVALASFVAAICGIGVILFTGLDPNISIDRYENDLSVTNSRLALMDRMLNDLRTGVTTGSGRIDAVQAMTEGARERVSNALSRAEEQEEAIRGLRAEIQRLQGELTKAQEHIRLFEGQK